LAGEGNVFAYKSVQATIVRPRDCKSETRSQPTVPSAANDVRFSTNVRLSRSATSRHPKRIPLPNRFRSLSIGA
jgi:hypothetical protein